MKRSRLLDHFCIIVEGSLIDCPNQKGGMTSESLLGTVAAKLRPPSKMPPPTANKPHESNRSHTP